MSIIDGLPINFEISEVAKSQIKHIRAAWPNRAGVLPGALSVAWGYMTTHDGKKSEGIVLGFYSEKETAGVLEALEYVSGEQVIFLITPKHYNEFQGKVIDYEEDRFFFLRDQS